MTLYHYTSTSFTFEGRTYRQDHHHKPRGLWLSVDDDWQQWCIGESFNEEGLTHRTEIILQPEANILYIETSEALDRFTTQFQKSAGRYDSYIDWAKVSAQYQGIIIAPYQWERRLSHHTFWYYTWDCASGCVWDCAAIRAERVTK